MYTTEISIENEKTQKIVTNTIQESIIRCNQIIRVKNNSYRKIFISFKDENQNRVGYWSNF